MALNDDHCFHQDGHGAHPVCSTVTSRATDAHHPPLSLQFGGRFGGTFGGLTGFMGGPGMMDNRFAARPEHYDEFFRAYSMAMLPGKERTQVSYGGKSEYRVG